MNHPNSSPSLGQRMMQVSDAELDELGVKTQDLDVTLVLTAVAIVLLIMLAVITCQEGLQPTKKPGLSQQGIQQPQTAAVR